LPLGCAPSISAENGYGTVNFASRFKPRRDPESSKLELSLFREGYSLGSFQQTSNPNQNYGANKCHDDGTYYAAAGPDS